MAFERSWNEVIDKLENAMKRRVTGLRTRLAQIVDANSANLAGANSILEKELAAKDRDLASYMNDTFKNGINTDQERLIHEL